MKKVIRNKKNKTFLTPAGEWTRHVWEAWDFKEHAEAVTMVRRFKLNAVEVYYSFQEEKANQWDFSVPLESAPAAGPAAPAASVLLPKRTE